MPARSALPQLTAQEVEDLRVFQRLHRENPQLNLVQLIDALRKAIGHEPSGLVVRIAGGHFNPYNELEKRSCDILF